jgi:uncharacterized protein (AIM24 family)
VSSHPRRVATTLGSLLIALTASIAPVAGQPADIRAWRAAHERVIVDELTTLVAIPNVAGVDVDLQRNAALLATMFERRGFRVEQTSGTGSPVLLASLDAQPSRGLITFP